MKLATAEVGIDAVHLLQRLTRVQPRPASARTPVSALFFINGALFATWVSRIPALQARHKLSHGELGAALFSMALGAIVAMPLAGLLTVRFGSRTVARVTAITYCAFTPLLALAPNTAAFVVTLVAFGAVHGGLDVAMNAQAVVVESRGRRPMMSSFHALFSIGGLAGSAGGGLLAGLNFSPADHFILVALLLGTAALAVFPSLNTGDEAPAHSSVAPQSPFSLKWPHPALLALGMVAFCSMVGEGAMADWSALYLRDVRHTSEGFATAGYAAFSIAMAVGRFSGDSLAVKFGPVRLVRIGAFSSTIGLLVALLVPGATTALIGFAGVGFGFSTIVPLVFSAAGRARGAAPGVAVASVTTIGYLGFIAGPPLIGFLAEIIGLRGALGILIATTLSAGALAPAVGPRRTS